MSLTRRTILGLALLVSLRLSYLQSDCFDASVLNLGSSSSTPESNNQKVSELVSAFKKKLIAKSAPVAQEIFSKTYSRHKDTCIVSSMNVYELPLKHPIFIEKIEETFGLLLDKLIEIEEFRSFPIDHRSFMFDPETKKVVFVDLVKILISEKLAVTKEAFKSQLLEDFKTFVAKLNNQIAEKFEFITDEAFKTELDKENLTYFDETFESTYVKSNSGQRSKIRKIVSDLPPPASNGQPTTTLKFKVDNYRYLSNIKAFINDKLSQTITFDEKTNAFSVFACYYYDNKYKQCKFIGDNDAFKSKEVTLPIASGYRIDVDITSNLVAKEESLVADDGYTRDYILNEAIYAHEIYLILVPENTPGLVSLNVNLEEVYVQTKFLGYFICVDRNKALKIKLISKAIPYQTTSILGKVSTALTFPEEVEVAVVPSYMETLNDCERGLWSIKIPKTSTLTFNEKTATSKPGPDFTLMNQGYEIGSNLMTNCADPNPKLKIGYNKDPKTVKFGETTKTYLTNVILKNDKNVTDSSYLCLGGDQQSGYYYSTHNVNFNDPANKYKFFFSFNSHDKYIRHDQNLEWIYVSSLFFNDFIYPYQAMKYPEANKNNLLVFVAKQQKMDQNEVIEFWARVYIVDQEANIHEVLSREEVQVIKDYKEKADDAAREYRTKDRDGRSQGYYTLENFVKTMDELEKKVKKLQGIINDAENSSILRFATMPEKFEMSKDKIFTFSESSTILYSSDNVVVYSFDYEKPATCNHYLIVPPIKKGEKLPPYPADLKISLECVDKKKFLFFGDGEQHVPDQKKIPVSIQRIAHQRYLANEKANGKNPDK